MSSIRTCDLLYGRRSPVRQEPVSRTGHLGGHGHTPFRYPREARRPDEYGRAARVPPHPAQPARGAPYDGGGRRGHRRRCRHRAGRAARVRRFPAVRARAPPHPLHAGRRRLAGRAVRQAPRLRRRPQDADAGLLAGPVRGEAAVHPDRYLALGPEPEDQHRGAAPDDAQPERRQDRRGRAVLRTRRTRPAAGGDDVLLRRRARRVRPGRPPQSGHARHLPHRTVPRRVLHLHGLRRPGRQLPRARQRPVAPGPEPGVPPARGRHLLRGPVGLGPGDGRL